MKKILTALFCLATFAAEAQIKQQLGTYGVRTRRMQADSAFKLPTFAVGIKDNYAGFDTAQLRYRFTDSTVLVYTGSQWIAVGGGGGGTVYVDSVFSRNDSLYYKKNGSEYFVKKLQPYGTIAGLLSAGTNVTVTGSGTTGSPYVISSSGGGSTLQQVLTAGSTLLSSQTIGMESAVALRFDQDPGALGYIFLNNGSDTIFSIEGSSAFFKAPTLFIKNTPYTLSTAGKKIMLRDTATGLVQNIDPALIGGGSQDLQQVTDLGNFTTDNIISGDTISSQFGFVRDIFTIGDSIQNLSKVALFIGMSVVQGVGVPTQLEAFPYKTGQRLGRTSLNRGIAGTTLLHHTANDSCFFDRLYWITTYNPATQDGIWIMYDINDANATYWATDDTAAYRVGVNRAIDSLVIRGYPLNKINWLSANYVDTSVTSNYDRIRLFVNVGLDAAGKKGVNTFDNFYPMEADGGSYYLADEDHPNELGTTWIANNIATQTTENIVGFFDLRGGGNIDDSLRIKGYLRLGTDTIGTQLGGGFKLVNTGPTYLGQRTSIGTTSQYGTSLVSLFHTIGVTGIDVRDGTSARMEITANQLKMIDGSDYISYEANRIYAPTSGLNFVHSGGVVGGYQGTYGGWNFGVNANLVVPDSSINVLQGAHFKRGIRASNLPTGKTAKQIYWNPSTESFQIGDSSGTASGGGGVSVAVDTIYRTPGKDSIQFTINGRYHAIKDSVGSGGGGGGSPAGNYGGVQLNRNGLFDVAASDSFQFNSGAVLAYGNAAGTKPAFASPDDPTTGIGNITGFDGYGAWVSNGTTVIGLFPNAMVFGNTTPINWGPAASPYGGGADVGIIRAATGMMKVTNASSGWGDLGVKNMIIGSSVTTATSATAALHLYNGTVPSASITDGVLLYSEDVAASAELKVRDEAGNITTISPHNFTGIPDGKSEDMAWSYYSEKDGKYINADMAKALRTIEYLSAEVERLKQIVEGKSKKPVKLIHTGKVKSK